MAIAAMAAASDDEDWDDEFLTLPPGLHASYRAADGRVLVERLEPLPRLTGQSPHPKVPAQEFGVTWSGRLVVPYDSPYTFTVPKCSLAEVTIRLNGEAVTPGQPVELEFGNVPLEIAGRQGGGSPEFQLAWESPAFAREPIPPRHFAHVAADRFTPEFARQQSEDAGAMLAEGFGCMRCHEGPAAWSRSLTEGLPPEALLPGPVLTGLHRRVHAAWLEQYLADPAAHRPGTRMPAMLGDGQQDVAARQTMAAYLSAGWPAAEVAGGSAQQGERRYAECGCAACHEPPEGSLGDVPTVPIPTLDRLAEKWTPAGLAEFLLAPLATRPHGRMPDFALAPAEAADLAAYLLTRPGAGQPPAMREVVEVTEGDAMRAVLPPGAVVALSLDEPAGPLADRAAGHDGRVQGVIARGEPGMVGRAIGLDGQGGHLVVEGSQKLGTRRDFTWSAWIRTEASGAIFARAPAEGVWVPGGKTLFVRGGRLCFDVGWVGVVSTPMAVDDGRWHHVAAVVRCGVEPEARDTVTLFVDGQPAASRSDWSIDEQSEEGFVLKLGKASDNFPQTESFRGKLDEAAVWQRALSDAEVAAMAEGFFLASVETARFQADELSAEWAALGGDAREFARLAPGQRLKAVALRQMTNYGCVNCHQLGAAPPSAVGLGKLGGGSLAAASAGVEGRGCLADAPSGKAPRFPLTEGERSALRDYVRSLAAWQTASQPEATRVEFGLLRCTACHENEGRGGEPLTALLGGAEAAQFILPPTLTGVAARLRPDRLAEYCREGTRYRRLRPWVGARMPGFGLRGQRLAALCAARDGVDAPLPPDQRRAESVEPAVPQNQVELGQSLVSAKGLTCVNCHALNGRQPSGDVDPTTRSPDLAEVTAHVRPEYFRRLLHDPGRIFPGTKMPVIFPKDGPPLAPTLRDVPEDVLLTTLWNYLSLGRAMPPAAETELPETLSGLLGVSVQRGPTYVGSRLFGRGIACGSTLGTLLYDADTLRPAALWFDGFLNRVPTNYFGMNWRAPEGFLFLDGGDQGFYLQMKETAGWLAPALPMECDPNTGSRFDGYTIGDRDVTFRYRLTLGGVRVAVTESVGLERRGPWRGVVRTLQVRGVPPGARLALALPGGEDCHFFRADGQPTDTPAGGGAVADAPILAYRVGQRREWGSAIAPNGSRWEVADGRCRVVLPPAEAEASPTLTVGRWFEGGASGHGADALAALARAPAEESLSTSASQSDDGAQGGASEEAAAAETPFTYRLETLPAAFDGWRPSGVAFASDGTIYAQDLTEGRVYRARRPGAAIPEDFRWELYATGLNVPTGMAVVDDRLFVSHRPEVTELIDADRDGRVETFRTLMGPWSLYDGFHEYAFGLAVDPQKRFYVGLNNGYFWSYGGPTHRGRHRSAVMRCDIDGHSEEWGWGCRVPNGICTGPDGQVFYVDNQGDWVQVCKLVHCRRGVFYGHPETEEQFLPQGQTPDGQSAVWIPYEVIRSAASLGFDATGGKFGPFAGQFFTGDVGYGQSVNIMRLAVERVGDTYQGAAFRFIDGPPHGPQHAAFSPDGSLYIACLTDGMVRLRWGGAVPLDIHHVALRRDNRGFVVRFTKPLAGDADVSPAAIRVRRWYYPYAIAYGSPHVGEAEVPVQSAALSADRQTLELTLPLETYANGMVYYLDFKPLRSADGDTLAHPEAWYTLQRLW